MASSDDEVLGTPNATGIRTGGYHWRNSQDTSGSLIQVGRGYFFLSPLLQ